MAGDLDRIGALISHQFSWDSLRMSQHLKNVWLDFIKPLPVGISLFIYKFQGFLERGSFLSRGFYPEPENILILTPKRPMFSLVLE